MKFRIGFDRELIADRQDLQPPFVKGVLAAYENKPEENPYKRQAYRDAYHLGYQSFTQGKVTVEEDERKEEHGDNSA